MKYLNALIPDFWQNFDHYLLLHYPDVWRTRIHQVLAVCLLMGTAFFILGYARPYELKEVICSSYYLDNLHEVFMPAIFIFGLLGLLFWRLKLRAFPVLATNFRQMGLLLLSCILGIGSTYYAGAAYFLGYNTRTTYDIEHILETDIDFLKEKNYLQLKGLVAFRDEEQLLQAFDYFEKGENLVISDPAHPSYLPRFNALKNGLHLDYYYGDGGSQFLPLSSFDYRSRNQTIGYSKSWTADSLNYYIAYYLDAEYNRINSLEKEDQHNSQYEVTYQHPNPDLDNAIAYLPRLEYHNLKPLLKSYSDLKQLRQYANGMPTAWLHVQLEWYQMLLDFHTSLDLKEVKEYQKHRASLAQDWLGGEGISGSLLITEIQAFSRSTSTKKTYAFLDQDSYERYERMCMFYRSKMPENIDKIAYNDLLEAPVLEAMISDYFAQQPMQTTVDSLYFYQPTQNGLEEAVQFRFLSFTYYQIWLKNLYTYYHQKFSSADQKRFTSICKKLGLENTFTDQGDYGTRQEGWLSAQEIQGNYRYGSGFTYKSHFLLPLLVQQTEDRLAELKQQKKAILGLQLIDDAPWLGPILLLLLSMAFFFLSVFNVRVLLISGLAVSLTTFVLVLLMESFRDHDAFYLLPSTHLLLLSYMIYRLTALPYQTSRGQIWFCSTCIFMGISPFLLGAYDNIYFYDTVNTIQFLTLTMSYTLIVYVVLFKLYFGQKHLPQKK